MCFKSKIETTCGHHRALTVTRYCRPRIDDFEEYMAEYRKKTGIDPSRDNFPDTFLPASCDDETLAPSQIETTKSGFPCRDCASSTIEKLQAKHFEWLAFLATQDAIGDCWYFYRINRPMREAMAAQGKASNNVNPSTNRSDSKKPATNGNDSKKPVTDVSKPPMDTQKPATDTKKPATDTKKPATDTKKPVTDTQKPSGAQNMPMASGASVVLKPNLFDFDPTPPPTIPGVLTVIRPQSFNPTPARNVARPNNARPSSNGSKSSSRRQY